MTSELASEPVREGPGRRAGPRDETTAADPPPAPGAAAGRTATRSGRRRRGPATALGLDRFSGLYVWAAVIAIFAFWVPSTFLTGNNFRLIAGQQAITALLALAVIVPMAAGAFDLSFAAIMGLSTMAVAYLQSHHWNALLAVVAGVLLGTLMGAVNGLFVTRFEVNSFVTTLAMSSVLAAATYWVSGGFPIVTGISPALVRVSTVQLFGISLVFYLMLAVALILWAVLEYTPVGRYLFAVGGNPQAARLAGLPVNKIIFFSLVTSGALSGSVGVLLLAQLRSASYDVGPPYLLPAFSAAFLGATQIKIGRVNVLGTLIAVYLLATGINGLQLAGAPPYISTLFGGVALLLAVTLAVRTARRRGTGRA
jgi:ribose transport system permease protein